MSSSNIAVKGGEVLAIVQARLEHTAGDPAARTLYSKLLLEAGKPYVRMLQTWVKSGRLCDPYDEFCVKESRFIDRGTLEVDYTDEYWERRYTVSSRLSLPPSHSIRVPPSISRTGEYFD
jgi:gamma-tubulin complex component 2